MRTAKTILKTLFLVAVLAWGQTAWGAVSKTAKTVTYTITASGTTLTFTPSGNTFDGKKDAKTCTFASSGFSIALHDNITFTCKSGTFKQDGNNIYGDGTVKYEITSTSYFFTSEVRNSSEATVAFTSERAKSHTHEISDGKRVGKIQLTLDNYWGTNDGLSEANAFEISDSIGLTYLSNFVNRGFDCKDFYFKLTQDVAFSPIKTWNDASSFWYNFEPIGNYMTGRCFAGTFNGQNYTIEGIRIYENEDFDTDDNIGLFGYINGGTIKNVILADSRITAHDNVGGIVGFMMGNGTVQNCHVKSTVAIHTVNKGNDGANYHGGIVGHIYGGTITNCTSAAIFTFASGQVGSCYGGIAGCLDGSAVSSCLTNCFALGVNIPYDSTDPATGASVRGAIVGDVIYATITNNYYSACDLAGSTSNIGTASGDVATNDGALPALRHEADNTTAISLLAALPANLEAYNVSIADRTLYKDNCWNTLCLPFKLGKTDAAAGHHFDGTPLAGAVVKELDTDGTYSGHKTGVVGNTLYLNFKEATSIEAGKPYFVKFSSGTNTVEPVFENIRVSNTEPISINSEDGNVTFKGRYDYYKYTADDPTVLMMGAETKKLYWPKSGASIGAFLAYFQLNKGITAVDPAGIKSFVLNLDDDSIDGIISLPTLNPQSSTSAAPWFTLDGRRLDKQPTQPGLYIVGGRKVVIK